MSYSEKNPKIDIYEDGQYRCSTNWAKTCREAVEKYLRRVPATTGKVTARKVKK